MSIFHLSVALLQPPLVSSSTACLPATPPLYLAWLPQSCLSHHRSSCVLSPYSHSDEGLLSGRRGGGDASRMWTSAVAACSTSSIVVSYAPVSWQRGSWGRGAPTLASVADGGGAGNKGSGPIGGWRKVSHICTAYGAREDFSVAKRFGEVQGNCWSYFFLILR
jgi:hypothetical protein